MSFKEETIVAFNNRKFVEAFTGKDSIYSKDPTWGGHDYLLVFYHLINWLETNTTPDVIKKIEDAFKDIFNSYRAISTINNGLESLNIIRAYCIQASEKKDWPISSDFFIMLIINNISNFNEEEIANFNIERDIESLRKYLPKLPSTNVIIGNNI